MNFDKIPLLAVLALLVVIYPSRGYIINEEGQLVPFRIYKKGGAQMCFLHPRNCRGGFHKRLTGGPDESQPNTIYDIRPKKRNSRLNSNVNERERTRPIFNPNDADIFNPSFRPEEEKPEMTSFVPVELTLLADYHDGILPHYEEQPPLPETHRMTRDPEFRETFKNVKGHLKQSRNANHIHEQYVPLGRELHVKDDSDLRYGNTWPTYASDSGVLLDFPPGFGNRGKSYSYSPEVDATRTGSKRFESAYDKASYPFRQRRNR